MSLTLPCPSVLPIPCLLFPQLGSNVPMQLSPHILNRHHPKPTLGNHQRFCCVGAAPGRAVAQSLGGCTVLSCSGRENRVFNEKLLVVLLSVGWSAVKDQDRSIADTLSASAIKLLLNVLSWCHLNPGFAVTGFCCLGVFPWQCNPKSLWQPWILGDGGAKTALANCLSPARLPALVRT